MGATERGFTLVELVTVMIVLGILAFTALPRFSAGLALKGSGVRDQVVATLRYAQKVAVSHRRLVCATVSADGLSLSLKIASAFGDGACATELPGPDGKQPAMTSGDPDTLIGPTGKTLYFQPGGIISSDAVGTTPAFGLMVKGQDDVAVYGSTGHVE